MKTKTLLLAAAVTLAAMAVRAYVVYNTPLVNDTELAYSQNYTINLKTTPNAGGIAFMTAQAIISSVTVPAVTFTDGRLSTASINVNTLADLASQAATNQVTVAATATILAASATNYLVVASTIDLPGAVITYNGNPIVGGTDWAIVDTTTGTAENIKRAINRFSGVTATRTNSQVDMRITAAGAAGNNKTLAVDNANITIGGGKFGGGYNNRIVNAYFTLNGLRYYSGSGWSAQDTSSGTATSIATWLNRQSGIKASAAASVVYATATVAGTAANSFTLASSAPSYLTVAGANFSGGRDNATVVINGITLRQGTAWTKASTSSGTAKAISDAIMASSSLNTIIHSTWSMIAVSSIGVVSATSTATGSGTAYTLATNAPNDLGLSAAAFQGGSNSGYATGGTVLTIPNHGLATGLGVVFSTSSGVGLAPLTWNTTYYVAKLTANTISISTTQASALLGNYIALGTQSTTGPHTFTLTPETILGTPTLQWQASTDCSNYFNLANSSFTFPSAYASASYSWDFGRVNYACIRAVYTAGSRGAVNLKVPVTGSN